MIKEDFYRQAAQSLTGRVCALDGEVLVFDEGYTPTDEEMTAIETRVLDLEADYESKQYARDRKAEYDKLNQFELQFDDKQDNGTRWVDAINNIKSQFPKE